MINYYVAIYNENIDALIKVEYFEEMDEAIQYFLKNDLSRGIDETYYKDIKDLLRYARRWDYSKGFGDTWKENDIKFYIEIGIDSEYFA